MLDHVVIRLVHHDRSITDFKVSLYERFVDVLTGYANADLAWEYGAVDMSQTPLEHGMFPGGLYFTVHRSADIQQADRRCPP